MADVDDDFVAEQVAVLAPGAGAAQAFDASGEVAEFNAGRAGGKDAAEGVVEFAEEGEFVAGAGGFGEGHEREAHGRFGQDKAAGDVGVADDLEHAGDEGAQALGGDDVFLELLFEKAGDAFGDVGGEPPTFVTGGFGGFGHGTLEPDALEFHGAFVREADKWQIVGEGDHGRGGLKVAGGGKFSPWRGGGGR